jgi:hypothetical protein
MEEIKLPKTVTLEGYLRKGERVSDKWLRYHELASVTSVRVIRTVYSTVVNVCSCYFDHFGKILRINRDYSP